MQLRLVVGLGNPGTQYEATRHNVGVWFVEALARHYSLTWRLETKFSGRIAQIQTPEACVWLLIPTTFMNLSGRSVGAMVRFHKIPPQAILVAHDELSFDPGIVRLKAEGGHGGHNGLRDIINQLQATQFNRLRIGIGHPGDKNQVSDYVLAKPKHHEQLLIEQSLDHAMTAFPDLLAGHFQHACHYLHNL